MREEGGGERERERVREGGGEGERDVWEKGGGEGGRDIKYSLLSQQEASMRTRSPSLNDIPVSGTIATQEGGHIVSTGTLAREREKFFDLLKSKYPEHGQGIEDFLSGSDRVADTVGLWGNPSN